MGRRSPPESESAPLRVGRCGALSTTTSCTSRARWTRCATLRCGEIWGRDGGEMARWTRCATSRGGRCGGGGDRTCAPTRGRFGGDVGESLARRPLRRREHSREPRRELTREWPRSGAVVRSGNDFDLIVNTLAAVFIVDIPALAYKATLPRHFRDTSETLPRHSRTRPSCDTSETPPRHVRDTSETCSRHFRDTSEAL